MEKRQVNFDYLRGLAILAVVLIHITAPRALDDHTTGIFLNQMARFGVPVFVFLSGWGLTIANSYTKSDNYLDFLKKRLSKLFPGYLLWNIVYLLYDAQVQGEMMPLVEAGRGLLYGTNYPHLYFVPLIVLFYVLYPLLMKIGKTHGGLALAFFVTLGSLNNTWGFTFQELTRNHNPLNWLFYFVFGIWVAHDSEQIKEKVSLIWALLLLVVSQVYVILEPIEILEESLLTQTRPSVLFYAMMVILFVVRLPSNWPSGLASILTTLSTYAFPIYLSHYLFIRVYRELLPPLPSLVMLPLVLISSIGLTVLKDRLKGFVLLRRKNVVK